MPNVLSLETILSEFNENTEAWLLADSTTFPYKYLSVPSKNGKQFYRFFMRKEDAEEFLIEILDVKVSLSEKRILPVKVKLLHTASLILMIPESYFSVHSPNEVFEYVQANN